MVTSLTVTNVGGGAYRLEWASDLASPTFYVYRDGVLVLTTQLTSLVVGDLVAGEAPVYEVLDDAAATPGSAYPNYALLAWYAGPGASEYLIEESAVGGYRDAVMADAPVGYWRLGETTGTFADSSGNGRNGTAAGSGGAMTRAAAGLPAGDSDAALHTTHAGNHRVSIADDAAFSPATISFEAWVKLDALPTGAERHWFVAKWINPNGFFLEAHSGGWRAWVGTTAGVSSINSASGFTTGTHHLVATYDGAHLRLYVDGVSAAAPVARTGGIGDNAVTLDIGSWSVGGTGAGGTVDEVAVYHGALSSGRIQAHYDAGTGVRPAAVPATWTERARVSDGGRPAAPTITVVQDGGTELDGTFVLEHAPSATSWYRWYWTDGTVTVELYPSLLLISDGSHFTTYEASPAFTFTERPPSGETTHVATAPWVLQLSNVTTGSPHGTVTVDADAADMFFARRYFTWLSRVLEDSATHKFRVTPIGDNGNPGTVKNFVVLMVRIPDPPAVSYAYDSGTAAVTISQA